MHPEDLLPPPDVGQGDHHLPIETARTQKRRIQHVRPVGGRDDDDPLVPVEPVHLDQQLVEGLLALVVAAPEPRPAVPADRIDLVDEDDARSVLLRLIEHVAHPRRADPDEHLDEVRARYGEERDLGLARDGLGEQGLAGARRPHHQHPAGDLAAEFLELAGVPQEVDQLADLLLRLFDAGHVGERDLDLVLADEPGAAPAEPTAPPGRCRRPASGA